MVANKLIKTYVKRNFYYKVPMHSLVFDAHWLFVDSDDSADVVYNGQFHYRLGAPVYTGAGSVIKRFAIRSGAKHLFIDPASVQNPQHSIAPWQSQRRHSDWLWRRDIHENTEDVPADHPTRWSLIQYYDATSITGTFGCINRPQDKRVKRSLVA